MLYTAEANPLDHWAKPTESTHAVKLAQTKRVEEREAVAKGGVESMAGEDRPRTTLDGGGRGGPAL